MAGRDKTHLNRIMFLEIEVYNQKWTQNSKFCLSAKYDK